MTRYRHPRTAALILAAGLGKRMNSDLAKVLHPVAGRPLLAWVLDTVHDLGVERVLTVVGHQRERVMEAFAGAGTEWVIQAEQRGTGHAARMAEPALAGFTGTLLVVCGDTPLLRAATLHALLEGHAARGAAVTVLSMRVPEPRGYGRILRNADGGLAAIVEEKDATPEQRRIAEVNSGVYAFDYPSLARALATLTTRNAQGEYYLTDTVARLAQEGLGAAVVCADEYRELLGINTVEQLAEAARVREELRAAEEGR
jgi:bifunctional UDP-N-acetylglucosamine pyrophosphorylase / glucosamine-1-phosphate N-acetyltransferase